MLNWGVVIETTANIKLSTQLLIAINFIFIISWMKTFFLKNRKKGQKLTWNKYMTKKISSCNKEKSSVVTSHQLLLLYFFFLLTQQPHEARKEEKNYRNIRRASSREKERETTENRERERVRERKPEPLAGVKLSIYLKLQSSSSSLFEVVVGSLSRTSLKAISVSLFHPENQMLIVILIRKS